MNEDQHHGEDVKLSGLLRESRLAPSLPPRFQEHVWRRIEDAGDEAGQTCSWLDLLVSRLLRPRLAFAGVAVLIVAGAFLGMQDGKQLARQHARAQYMTFVAPNPLR